MKETNGYDPMKSTGKYKEKIFKEIWETKLKDCVKGSEYNMNYHNDRESGMSFSRNSSESLFKRWVMSSRRRYYWEIKENQD